MAAKESNVRVEANVDSPIQWEKGVPTAAPELSWNWQKETEQPKESNLQAQQASTITSCWTLGHFRQFLAIDSRVRKWHFGSPTCFRGDLEAR